MKDSANNPGPKPSRRKRSLARYRMNAETYGPRSEAFWKRYSEITQERARLKESLDSEPSLVKRKEMRERRRQLLAEWKAMRDGRDLEATAATKDGE